MPDTKDVRERMKQTLRKCVRELNSTKTWTVDDNFDAGYQVLADAALSTLTLADHIAAVEAAGVPVLKLLADAADTIQCLKKCGGAFDVATTLGELDTAIALIEAARDAE